MSKYEVTVIVVTFNSELSKLILTLKSIVFQKNISMQLIIADDGSELSLEKDVDRFMMDYKNISYKFIASGCNYGTVINIYNALQYACGEYVKIISPGDAFYDEGALSKWIEYMKKNDCRISFCDCALYSITSDKKKIRQHPTNGSPVLKKLYITRDNYKKCFVDYILANDTAIGAGVIFKTCVAMEYFSLIVDKIKYAEDYFLRIALFDGEMIYYYPSNAVWYEYGGGISTSGNSKWAKALKKDFFACNEILINRNAKSNIAKRYQKYLRINNYSQKKFLKCIMFPLIVKYRIHMKLAPQIIDQSININNLKRYL